MIKFHPQKFEKSQKREKLFFENLEIDIDFEESLQEENEDINIKDYL